MPALHLIGSGTPTPTETRFGTCLVLEIGADLLMFDCGPASTYKMARAGLWPTRIDHLFFTHHHFDHNVDYPCFLLCRWDQSTGKENVLNVFGPPPTQWITDRLVGPEGAFRDDWTARVKAPVSQHVFKNRGGTLPRPTPVHNVRDIAPGPVVEKNGWKVTAAPTRHVGPWLESLAYRVDAPGLRITIAGDTEYCSSLMDLAKGSDVFVANCWDHQDTMEANGEAPGQTGTLDAARMASESGASTLVLTHTGRRIAAPGSREKAVADIARTYSGRIVFGEEGMKLDLGTP